MNEMELQMHSKYNRLIHKLCSKIFRHMRRFQNAPIKMLLAVKLTIKFSYLLLYYSPVHITALFA